MPRGGRRIGAGRRRKLDHLARMAVGSACERRFNDTWNEARQLAWRSRPGYDEREALLLEYRAIPISERPSFHRSARGVEWAEESEQAIRVMRNTPDWVRHTNRNFTLDAPRPKSVCNKICETVAAEFSAKWLVQLLPSYVLKCWNEYRAFERATEAHEV